MNKKLHVSKNLYKRLNETIVSTSRFMKKHLDHKIDE
jgi:hypothetical protein